MAKTRTGKPSRKKRKKQRIKSERASGRGLPSRTVKKPAKKKTSQKPAGEKTPAESRRPRRRDSDGQAVPHARAREADAGVPPAPSLTERIRALPSGAKIAAVAVVVVAAIWGIARVRDRGSAARPTEATKEAVTSVSAPPSVPAPVEKAGAQDAGPVGSIMMAGAADAAPEEKPDAAAEEKSPPPTEPAPAEKKPKAPEPAEKATAPKPATTPEKPKPATVAKPKPVATAKPKAPVAPKPKPKPKPAPAGDDNPY